MLRRHFFRLAVACMALPLIGQIRLPGRSMTLRELIEHKRRLHMTKVAESMERAAWKEPKRVP